MKNSSQKSRFLTVGVLNTLVDFVVLFTLTNFGMSRFVANIFSTTAAFATSFFANKNYTFRSSETNIRQELWKFVAFTLFSIWVVQSAILAVTTPFLEKLIGNDQIALLIAKSLAIGCGLIWNYFTYSRFVFKKK